MKNLSDTRGNSAGIFFFRVFMRVFGLYHACLFVAFPAFFYALFDRKARLAAQPVLTSLFPDAKGFKQWWNCYRLMISQGRVLLAAAWMRNGGKLPYYEHNPEPVRALFRTEGQGIILLISHVGCWQAALPGLEQYQKPVNLLIQENHNESIASLFGDNVRLIDNASAFGGLLDCMAALERGEILCVMGDRLPGDNEDALDMEVNGRCFRIPVSPWLLAARCRCPLIPVFALLRGNGDGIELEFSPPINVPAGARRNRGEGYLFESINAYSAALADVSKRYPYQVFQYENPR